jgi:hypothetical protein
MINLEFDYCGWPINSPIFISICPLKAILIKKLFDKFYCTILEFVKVANLIMLGHITYLGERISNTALSLFTLLIISFLNTLDLLRDNLFSL